MIRINILPQCSNGLCHSNFVQSYPISQKVFYQNWFRSIFPLELSNSCLDISFNEDFMQNMSKQNVVNWLLLSTYFHWTEVFFDLHQWYFVT